MHENVAKVATIVNELGFRIGKRKVIGTDVSEMLRAKTMDELDEMAVKLFKQSRKNGKGASVSGKYEKLCGSSPIN